MALPGRPGETGGSPKTVSILSDGSFSFVRNSSKVEIATMTRPPNKAITPRYLMIHGPSLQPGREVIFPPYQVKDSQAENCEP